MPEVVMSSGFFYSSASFYRCTEVSKTEGLSLNIPWVDFLKFNRKYRPEVAAATKVVYIRTECCSKPGAIPQTQLDSRIDDRVCCPHCGRWTHYEIMTTLEMEERTYVCE